LIQLSAAVYRKRRLVMTRVEAKNLIPICILKILEEHSDPDHRLTQEEINEYLYKEYGIEYEISKKDPVTHNKVPTGVTAHGVDRKTIGTTIDNLKYQLELPVEKDQREGAWMDDRPFTDYELQLLMDSVFYYRFITPKDSKALIDKLAKLGNEYYRKSPHLQYMFSLDNLGKAEGHNPFYSINAICYAIDHNRQIEFDFNKLGADRKLYKTRTHRVSPFRFIIKNSRYYLMAYHEEFKKMEFFRLDHITNANIVEKSKRTSFREIKGWESGITNDKLASKPYLFSDNPERITFQVSEASLDYVFDWIGTDVMIDSVKKSPKDEGKVKVTVLSSPTAMKYLALQFMDCMEILTPASLRNEVKKALDNAQQKYK